MKYYRVVLTLIFLSACTSKNVSERVPQQVGTGGIGSLTDSSLNLGNTICTAGSSQQMQDFKSDISSQKNYRFLGMKTGSNTWVQSSCAAPVTCDSVVISNQEMVSFLSQIQQVSDKPTRSQEAFLQNCSSVLEKPKNLFIVGCFNFNPESPSNFRSRAEYVQLLRADGFTEREAELVAQARYNEQEAVRNPNDYYQSLLKDGFKPEDAQKIVQVRYSKSTDRTREEYLDLLLKDGFNHDQASKIAEYLYGKREDFFKRVFSNYENIYEKCGNRILKVK